MKQLVCKICKTKRELNEDEMRESVEIVGRKNLKVDDLVKIWSIFDGETCPEGGNHDYDWDDEFFQKMLDNATEIRKNNGEIVRGKNEIIELEEKVDKLREETENEVKRITEEVMDKKITVENLEKRNEELKNNVKIESGREWSSWV